MVNEEKPRRGRYLQDSQWWNVDDELQAGQMLVGLVRAADTDSTVLRDNTRRLICIYEYGSRSEATSGGSPSNDVSLDERTSHFNVARNVIDTMAAKLCKSRIAPMVLTEGGGLIERHRARKVDKAIEGEFDANNWTRIKNDMILDALVTDHGAGACKVYERDGRVCIEHVPIERLRFDKHEAKNRDPRSIFEVNDIDQFQLAAMFPGREEAIARAAGNGRAEDGQTIGSDRVIVYEGWHLPSGPDTGDGRHVMAIDGATLVDEPWEDDCFPFVLYVPRRRRRSVWGLSRMRDCAGAQREHEKLTEKFQKAHHTMGLSGFLVPRQANLNPLEITNIPGLFVEYDGMQPPMPFTPQPVHGDQYAYRDSIVRDMGNSVGISQLSSTSQLPAGLQQASGKALQVFEDFESERLAQDHQELEQTHIDVSKRIMRTAKRISENDASYAAKYRDKHGYQKIKWAEVLKDYEDFVLRVFPVSALAKTPSAKFAQLQELLNSEAITIEQFKRLYDLPDLDSEMDLDNADTDVIDLVLEQIVIEGKQHRPEPFDDLQLMLKRAGKYYNLCRTRGVPDAALERLREFMAMTKELLEPPPTDPAEAVPDGLAAPGEAPPGEPPMPPGGAPPMPPGGGTLPPMMPPVAA